MATYTQLHHFELDLSAACYPNSISGRLNDVVPVLKTSTAFFTFLRANLALQPSAMSNVSTPLLEPVGVNQGLTTQSSPSPLSRHVTHANEDSSPQPQANLEDIPPLSLDVLTTRNDKVEALKLVADSIAQQRQRASLGLVFHPLLLSGLVASLALTYQVAWARKPQPQRDLGVALALFSGVVMAYLLAIRYATSGYIQIAESLGWDWLVSPDTADEDVVIGTRFGSELIGALFLRLEPTSGHRGKRRGTQTMRGGKGVIRAWTTKLRYRGKGVGADMLQEAVRVTRERCGRDAEVGFAAEHANSQMVLPEMFNKPFRNGERKAAGALEKAVAEWEGGRRKR
ncbi:hypothetical protein KVR01_002911 [Diaporthe batatas]|uniref:uncharacterized protein n=1 Tax=Diaporthe batatas TaxID=748121 RepID=UPI001D05C13A|nr:uncharacterized protein KVR01_002911 [Diaporthe batatas]KAG8167222.1 hypothetical protein KVR01_002911 [Diaporthe batatas]